MKQACFCFHILFIGTDWMKLHSKTLPLHCPLFFVAPASLFSLLILQTTLQLFVTDSRFPFFPHYHLSFGQSDFSNISLLLLHCKKYPSS